MKQPSKAILKFISLFVIAAVIIIAVVLVIVRTDHGANSPESPTQTKAQTTPDPVKDDSGNTGDATPSPTGTSPDGNNSLLSQ